MVRRVLLKRHMPKKSHVPFILFPYADGMRPPQRLLLIERSEKGSKLRKCCLIERNTKSWVGTVLPSWLNGTEFFRMSARRLEYCNGLSRQALFFSDVLEL